MTCADFQDRLSAYMDGELPRWKRWKVQTHLRQCRECAVLLRDLQEVDEALIEGLQSAPAPDYLTGAVMRRLPVLPLAWRRHGGVLPWAAGLAVAGMQVVALYGVYTWGYAQGAVGQTGRAIGALPSIPIPAPLAPAGDGRRDDAPVPREERSDAAAGRLVVPGGILARTDSQFAQPAEHLTSLDAGAVGAVRQNPVPLKSCPRCGHLTPSLSGAR
jgi:anti-sigma factor RsiW